VNQLCEFIDHIKLGDYIVANKGATKVLGIGIITGSYFFVPNYKIGNRLPLNWIDLTPRGVVDKGWVKTNM
jgi:predicted Mrr-cat superfamily restriction endonuclease